MSRSKFLLVAIITTGIAMIAPAKSNAAFTLTLNAGAETLTITASAATPGAISSGQNGILNSYTITTANGGSYTISGISAATSSPGVNAFTGAATLRSSMTIIANGGSATAPLTTLTFALFSDGYSFPGVTPGSPYSVLVENSISASTSDVGTSQTRTTITPPGGASGTTPFATVTSPIPGSGSNPPTSVIVTLSSSPFSLSNNGSASGMFGGATWQGTIASQATIVATPAPAGLVLLATALPFAGLIRRRLRKAEIATAA